MLLPAVHSYIETYLACSYEKPFIIVVVSSLAALIKDQVTFQQRIVGAAKVGDAKEVAEVANDKRRKLTAGVPQP